MIKNLNTQILSSLQNNIAMLEYETLDSNTTSSNEDFQVKNYCNITSDLLCS